MCRSFVSFQIFEIPRQRTKKKSKSYLVTNTKLSTETLFEKKQVCSYRDFLALKKGKENWLLLWEFLV